MSASLNFRNSRNIEFAVSQPQAGAEETVQSQIKNNLQIVSKVKYKKTSLILPCFLVLSVALLGVLFLKIQITQQQYQIVQLRNEVLSAQRQGQSLLEEVGALSAPGNLVKQASDLGMVQSSNHLFIDLQTGQVNGELVDIPVPVDPQIAVADPQIVVADPQIVVDSQNSEMESVFSGNIPAPTQSN